MRRSRSTFAIRSGIDWSSRLPSTTKPKRNYNIYETEDDAGLALCRARRGRFCSFFGGPGCSERNSPLENNKSVVRRVHEELWSEGDLAAIDELVASDFYGHAPLGSDWQGPQGLRTRIRAHRATFPDWNERVEELVAEGDLVVVRFTSTGTDRGGFRGNRPRADRSRSESSRSIGWQKGRLSNSGCFPTS